MDESHSNPAAGASTAADPGTLSAAALRAAAVHRARQRAADQHLAQAQVVWRSLSSRVQLELAREASETRDSELRLAYPDLLSVGYGYRVTGDADRQTTREPCVTFVVERKWPRGKPPPKSKRALPGHLSAYVELLSRRRPCAIPTDVRGLQKAGMFRPHGNQFVLAYDGGASACEGVPCCTVEVGGLRYLLGCHHVFAMSDAKTPVPDAVQILSLDGVRIANLSAYYGSLSLDGTFFDAALAIPLTSDIPPRFVTEPVANSPIVQDEQGLAINCQVRTARGVQVYGDRTAVHRNFVLPSYGALGQVTLPVAVELQTAYGALGGGDSGSPVFDASGAVFQGMYIAGNDIGGALFIPAYELLLARNYAVSGDGEMLRLA